MPQDSEGRRWLRRILPSLPDNPSLFPHQVDLDQNLILMIEMGEPDYRRAAFLDERAISAETRGSWLPLRRLLDVRENIRTRQPPVWMFHVGHCGSTLISRLLGEHPDVLALREPSVLQALSFAQRHGADLTSELFGLCTALLSRTYREDQRALIKVTSDCANLVTPLLEFDRHYRMFFLSVALDTYCATMLRAPALRQDLALRHDARKQDLGQMLGTAIDTCDDDAERAAIAWLSSMAAFLRARNGDGDRVYHLDFDDFLAAPRTNLAAAADFIGTPFADDRLDTILAGPLMRRYAKNTNKAFDATTRGDQLQAARSRYAPEISAALGFAENFCTRFPVLTGLADYFRAEQP